MIGSAKKMYKSPMINQPCYYCSHYPPKHRKRFTMKDLSNILAYYCDERNKSKNKRLLLFKSYFSRVLKTIKGKQNEFNKLASIEFEYHSHILTVLEARTKDWPKEKLLFSIHYLKMYLSGLNERNSALLIIASIFAISALLVKTISISYLLIGIFIVALLIPIERGDLSRQKQNTEELVEHLEFILKQRDMKAE